MKHAIDLLNLNDHDKLLLALLLEQYNDITTFAPGKVFTLVEKQKVEEQVEQSRWFFFSRKTENVTTTIIKHHDVTLSHKVLKHESATHNYYYIIGNEGLGQGAFGQVKECLLELKFNKETKGLEIASSNNVAKYIEGLDTEEFSRFIDNEFTHLQEIYPQAKKIVDKCESLSINTAIAELFSLKSAACWLIMPKETGLSLDNINPNELSLTQKFKIALLLTQELMRLHDPMIYGGIHIHNDIKPANIMVNLDPLRVRFVDYGLAKRKGELTTGGTPLYAAPENAGLSVPSNQTGDVYSLGFVLFQLFEPSENAFKSLPQKAYKRLHITEPEYQSVKICGNKLGLFFDKKLKKGKMYSITHKAQLDGLGQKEGQAFYDLLKKMFSNKPQKRPSLEMVYTKLLKVALSLDKFNSDFMLNVKRI
jgi:serine/threonine protein kinase